MIIVVDGVETEVEGLINFGHRFPDGSVTEHTNASSALAGASLFGGEVVAHFSYVTPWFALSADHQPQWVIPE